jgi:hypothetical protein
MSIKAEGSRMIKYSTFNHNKFYFENETNMIDPVIEIPNSFYGNDFINNKLIARPNAVVGKSMRIDGRNGTITLNRQTQNFGEIEVTASNANTLNENNMKFA